MYTKNVEILKKVLVSRVQRLTQVSVEVNNLSKEVGTIAGTMQRLGVSLKEINKIITDNSQF
nr:MAG TPA: hypothetical protein [Caudoviricetes sp.]